MMARPVVELRGFEPLTPCMPCSVAPSRRSRSVASGERNGCLGVTVTDRWVPLVTAACGTRVARPARTTMLGRGGDGSPAQPEGEARPR
jgi:hypothetical protein